MNKLQLSTQQLLKEALEKSRGWEDHPAPEQVELAFKKVNEGRMKKRRDMKRTHQSEKQRRILKIQKTRREVSSSL